MQCSRDEGALPSGRYQVPAVDGLQHGAQVIGARTQVGRGHLVNVRHPCPRARLDLSVFTAYDAPVEMAASQAWQHAGSVKKPGVEEVRAAWEELPIPLWLPRN